MPETKIRDFKHCDAEAVVPLIHQLTRNVVEPELLLQRLRSIATKNYPGAFACVVAEQAERVVGFGEIVFYPIPSKGLMAMIEEVVIDENYRGQGISRLITDALIKVGEANSVTQIKLTAGNPIAQKSYEKSGFVNKGEDLFVKKYY